MSAVFGERLPSIPVSSNKSMIGHTLTAAGAVEAVFSLQTMLSGTLPPTINYQNPDPAIVLDVVPNVKRSQQVTAVLSNSFWLRRPETQPCHDRRAGLSRSMTEYLPARKGKTMRALPLLEPQA